MMNKQMKKIGKFFKQTWRRWSWGLYRKRRIVKRQYLDLVKDLREVRLHLGCGDKKFEGYINIDIVPTEGSDMAMDVSDLNMIPSGSVSEIFMKSVFEHFYSDQQDQALREYNRVLKKGGKLIIRVPDFDVVIDAYLRKEKGIVGEIFDFSHVRQYVCGELAPQNRVPSLHKDIFNKKSLGSLLEKNGFTIESLENVFFEDQHIALSIMATAIKK